MDKDRNKAYWLFNTLVSKQESRGAAN